MARYKGQDELIRTVRKDWYYFKGDKLGKKERRWRLVFEYIDANGEKRVIKDNTFTTKTAADFKLRALTLEHAKKGDAFAHRGLLFEDYAKAYKRDKLAAIDDSGKAIKLHIGTGKTECSKVDMMITFFKGRKLDSIRRPQCKAFMAYLEELESKQTKRKLTPRTVHTYMERLRALLFEAKADDFINSVPNISGLLDRNLERKRTDKSITTAQLFDLLAKCDEPIKGGGRFRDRKHLKLPLIASHELGCRVGELKDAKRSDILYIDHEEKCGVIRMRNNKASNLKGRDIFKDVPFGELLYDEIMANGVLDLAHDAIAIMRYPYYKTAWNTLRDMAGLSDIHWHDLRAVNATKRKQSGQDLPTIQEQIGHEKDSSITEDRYFRELVGTIKEYNDYMKYKRQQSTKETDDVLNAETLV